MLKRVTAVGLVALGLAAGLAQPAQAATWSKGKHVRHVTVRGVGFTVRGRHGYAGHPRADYAEVTGPKPARVTIRFIAGGAEHVMTFPAETMHWSAARGTYVAAHSAADPKDQNWDEAYVKITWRGRTGDTWVKTVG